jgi:hypothetical protein
MWYAGYMVSLAERGSVLYAGGMRSQFGAQVAPALYICNYVQFGLRFIFEKWIDRIIKIFYVFVLEVNHV